MASCSCSDSLPAQIIKHYSLQSFCARNQISMATSSKHDEMLSISYFDVICCSSKLRKQHKRHSLIEFSAPFSVICYEKAFVFCYGNKKLVRACT